MSIKKARKMIDQLNKEESRPDLAIWTVGLKEKPKNWDTAKIRIKQDMGFNDINDQK